MKKHDLPFFLLFFSLTSLSAQNINWDKITPNLVRKGGHVKALRHMKCFVDNYYGKKIELKKPDHTYSNTRCYSKESLALEKTDYMLLIDYTLSGMKRRLFLINTKDSSVTALGVSHGRYKSGYIRLFTGRNKNSVRWAKYFSNTPNSRASSTGFFFAGQSYSGKFGRSLVLHGLEPGVNDYACERSIVLHKHWSVSKRRAYTMSSGCPMVTKSYLNRIINATKGSQSGMKIKSAGALVFIYGPRERRWKENQCSL